MIANLHLPGTRNIGDEIGTPSRWLGIGESYSITAPPPADAYVYGGGCVATRAVRHSRLQQVPTIAWAVGTTKRYSRGKPPPFDYRSFDLASTRDWPPPPGVDWVPCPSCMSPLFDDPPAPTAQTVEYGHARLSPMSSLNNNCMDFERVIRHLCSGEEVVTSSYHGMVWATWLGRKVRVVPFGAKFHGWPYAWGSLHPNSLEEARQANKKFRARAMGVLG